ncbi:SDR family oxidoreductase [Gilvimarinus algae]|uniref:SDR family oxidoreductase n=1 Tax=Gilvimarinus algae TaxID=3058037 RepID=A0ABT8TBT0_9GAMM|nr:SDR family oxidoreductase [Gilvimarinus sp. SDUM040014]MDO3381375.1 SDR family oxidoreductase [Gilvimarinus sp. SDUM040014]
MDSEKLLVIGCGDLGRRLAHHLNDSSVQVTGLRRHPPHTPHEGLTYVSADAADASALQQILASGYDYIVMTPTPTARTDEGYERGYLAPCRALVQALAASPAPKKVVMVSSTSVYGQNHGEWIDEQAEALPSKFNGRRILEAEALLADAGLPLTVLRLAGIYGPGRDRLLDSVRSARARASQAYTNRIHAEDAAGFIAYLLTEVGPVAPLYLVSDGESPTKAQVVRWLAGALGVAEPPPGDADGDLNKRIDNRRMLSTGYRLRYESFTEGFAELIQRSP